MMAFFDSLIQREIEGWDSSSENTLSTDSDDFEKVYSKNIYLFIYLLWKYSHFRIIQML